MDASKRKCVCVCLRSHIAGTFLGARVPVVVHVSGVKSLSKVSLSLGEINERLCDLAERGVMEA